MRIRRHFPGSVVLAAALVAAAGPGRATPADGRETGPRTDAALMAAARDGDLALIAARLDAGADVNAPAVSGETPLLRAVTSGQLEATRLLVDAGADVNANARGFGSPLDAAERGGHDAVASLLRAAGARSATGRAVGDTVCVRPWHGDGYCGTVEEARGPTCRVRVTEIVGCADGCPARAECSEGRTVGGRAGVRVGDDVTTKSWCLTHTGVVP